VEFVLGRGDFEWWLWMPDGGLLRVFISLCFAWVAWMAVRVALIICRGGEAIDFCTVAFCMVEGWS
jgi:hypothetical protein